jgi:hypothetical protein
MLALIKHNALIVEVLNPLHLPQAVYIEPGSRTTVTIK